MPAYGKSRGEPAALVIVPTRELATQVRGELAWLLADTRLRLASFTGGTPVSGDLRTLERGVDVVIGTPGRLVDLLRRERLPLGGLKAVVLDEADEMLDLGFREDLETILKAAPAERRTLLLSATIPPEIRAMAKRFQRDAVAIDPRRSQPGGAAPSQAHDDISYVAHLVSGGDRLGAVVNVLRASDSERAIVFVTTREAVADLHAALVARGFAATAISGDRAQAERDRALDQLRRGEVRILVATNVAARGLHLPDVDLIVHADLPLNAESLTHRSGRTGRAGRKGTAVIISTPAERRKAERLLMSAHVKPVWTPLPSREAIAAAARERLATELLAPVVGDEPALAEGADALALRLEAELPAPALIRRLLGARARSPSGGRGRSVGRGAAPRGRARVRRRTRRRIRRPQRAPAPARPGRAVEGGGPLSREHRRQGQRRSALDVAAHLPARRRHPARGGRDPRSVRTRRRSRSPATPRLNSPMPPRRAIRAPATWSSRAPTRGRQRRRLRPNTAPKRHDRQRRPHAPAREHARPSDGRRSPPRTEARARSQAPRRVRAVLASARQATAPSGAWPRREARAPPGVGPPGEAARGRQAAPAREALPEREAPRARASPPT